MRKLTIILTAFVCLSASAQTHYPIKNFLGAVIHPWDEVSSYGQYNSNLTPRIQQSIVDLKLTRVRLYSDVDKDKDAQNLTYRLSPEGRGFPIDEGLQSLKQKIPGFQVLYCYQGQPQNIQQEWTGIKSTQYRHLNSDLTNPSTWSEISHDLFVLAARGGRNKNVPDYPLTPIVNWWDVPQTMYKGANFIDALEGNNEVDNKYSNAYPLNGTQYAIAWSPMYDSVKKADPTMLVSTTGLCEADPQTLIDAWAWVNTHRGGRFPADLVQPHVYPWGWALGLSGGLPPEMFFIGDIKKMIVAANGIPVILGEWSWDINRDSPINAPAFSTYSAEKCRGNFVVRAIFLFSRIGLQSSYFYRINQDYFSGDPLGGNFANDNNGVQFATSALRRQIDDSCHFILTTAGDYMRQISVFGDYSFSEALKEDTIYVLRFTKPNAPDLYVMWTTEKVTPWTDYKGVSHPQLTETFATYKPNINGTRLDLNNDSSGVLLSQPFYSFQSVNLSSKPVFILANSTVLPIKLRSFTAEKINQAAVLKWVVDGTDNIVVQRSADGRNFSDLGTGIFNKYVDMHPLYGKNYYRLKMIDVDGSFSYSPIRLIEFNVHQQLTVIDDLGRTMKEGYSEDEQRFKSELPIGNYLFQYNDLNNHAFFTEKFRKL